MIIEAYLDLVFFAYLNTHAMYFDWKEGNLGDWFLTHTDRFNSSLALITVLYTLALPFYIYIIIRLN